MKLPNAMIVGLIILLQTLGISSALIPASPEEQTRLAIRSLRNTINTQNDEASSTKRRLYVDYLIPLPPETNAADVDPWPGGLAQQYPYAENIVKEVLAGIVDEPAGPCSSQILSAMDNCGFFVQESNTSPKNDVAAILFPCVDQLDKIEQIENMVGERTLLLFNKQFQRPADFGFTDKGRATKLVFDRYKWGFAFQEFACRGEDVKLIYDYPNWSSCVICDEDQEKGREEIKLLDSQLERPLYEDLEKKINEVLPQPLWMRKMGEVETKGFKFQRGKK